MKKLLLFLGALAAYGQTVTISDTLPNAVGGGQWTGRITVVLNSPGRASYGAVALSGWQYTLCVGVTGSDCSATTAAGVITVPLYATSTLTPTGLSYLARYQPSKGSPRTETWVVEPSDTTLAGIITDTVSSPTTTYQPSQILSGGASSGQCLVYDGSTWSPGSCSSGGGSGTVTSVSVATANGVSGSVANATTTPAITLTLGAITPASVAAVGNVTGANLSGTNTGDQTTITGNAGTATALAANGANCSAGSFPLGVDAAGAAETCTALPVTIAGTANQITASAATGAITLSIPTNPTLPGTTSGTFSGALTGNASTASALAANPADCTSGQYASAIAANGDLTCAAVAYSQVTGTPSLATVATSGSVSDLGSGTLAAARGGAGTVSGILKANGSGVVSAATSGTDYVVPAGNVATATALAANPANCSGSLPRGVDASGAAEGCADVDLTSEVTGVLPDANIASGITRTIASGSKALDTDAIASGACDTLATTSATGVASTDVVTFSANADITAVTGYAPVTTGGLAVYAWPTSNTINWKICNPTASSVTPGAVTLNWRVVR